MITLEEEIKKQVSIIKRKSSKIITLEELKIKIKKSLLEQKPLRVKLGIDPTAPDIHLGFAVVLKKMREFQELGHKAVLIIGDFTAKIGDPTGKKITRPQLSDQEVKKNMKSYLKQASKILKQDNLEIRYNSEWLSKLNLNSIIKLFSQVTLQQIIEREDFQNRLKENNPIYLHELIYPMLQAYDSVNVEADIELGGSDQEFNCITGRILQSKFGQEKQVIVLLPLLLGLDKRKMSKSYGNYIGISESPDEIYGKTMSLPDECMMQWFDLLTNFSSAEIKKILSGHPKEAKEKLAFEIVKEYYDEHLAQKTQDNFRDIFQEKKMPSSPVEITVNSTYNFSSLINFLFDFKITKSKSEARHLLASGAVEVNGEKINLATAKNIRLKDGTFFKVGKHRFFKIRYKE